MIYLTIIMTAIVTLFLFSQLKGNGIDHVALKLNFLVKFKVLLRFLHCT